MWNTTNWHNRLKIGKKSTCAAVSTFGGKSNLRISHKYSSPFEHWRHEQHAHLDPVAHVWIRRGRFTLHLSVVRANIQPFAKQYDQKARLTYEKAAVNSSTVFYDRYNNIVPNNSGTIGERLTCGNDSCHRHSRRYRCHIRQARACSLRHNCPASPLRTYEAVRTRQNTGSSQENTVNVAACQPTSPKNYHRL